MSSELPWSIERATQYGRQVMAGERVRLRGLRDDDLPALASWWQDPELNALQMTSVVPSSESAARDLFTRWGANQDNGVGFCIETLPRSDTPGALVGNVTLFDVRPKARSAKFAIGLGSGFLGLGYSTDATRIAVRYGFREMNLHRIELSTLTFNERAIAAYRKAGFREEGRRRDAVFHDGAYFDELLMSILSTDQ